MNKSKSIIKKAVVLLIVIVLSAQTVRAYSSVQARVANKTITYHKPGYQMGTVVDIKTKDDGSFTIENAQYLANATGENYYGDFTFAGDGKYKECSYEGNVTVVAN